MKAALIDACGGVERIRLADVPEPEPGPVDVVVEVRAAALNHLDIWVRRGSRGRELKGPHVLGSDAAGVIVAAGAAVRGPKEGDEVVIQPGLSCGACEACRRGEQSECASFDIVGLGRDGAFAERVAVPAANVYPRPAHLSWEQAAALPLAYVTAWRMLMTRAKLRAGETVLIHGVGGGVALAGLQIARLAGARVIVTSSSPEKLERALRLGAHHAVNYREADVVEEVKRLTGGRGVDVVQDSAGAATWPADIRCLRRGGRLALCGVTTGAEAPTDLRAVYWNQLEIYGSTMGSAEDFRALLAAVAAVRLEPVLDSVYPLEEVRAATERMESGRQFGKIVLRVR